MIEYVTAYILAGLLFILFVEWAYSFENHDDPLTNPERVFLSILWPIGFVVALYSFVKYLFNRK